MLTFGGDLESLYRSGVYVLVLMPARVFEENAGVADHTVSLIVE